MVIRVRPMALLGFQPPRNRRGVVRQFERELRLKGTCTEGKRGVPSIHLDRRLSAGGSGRAELKIAALHDAVAKVERLPRSIYRRLGFTTDPPRAEHMPHA